jgi:hypothetical protein
MPFKKLFMKLPGLQLQEFRLQQDGTFITTNVVETQG